MRREERRMQNLESEALQLLGAAEYTLAHPEVDSWSSERWAQEIVRRLAPMLGGSSRTGDRTKSDGTHEPERCDTSASGRGK